MRIKITADSTSDLSREMLERYKISTIPLYVLKEGKAHRDGVDITPSDIFRHVEGGGELCSTAAVNVNDYAEFFEALSGECDEVIHINIGAEFSASYQNACIAAKPYKNVHLFDSKSLSTGQGILAVEADEMAERGMDAESICRELDGLAKRVEVSFLINRLDYLRKGGRCSYLDALGGNILRLNPCIEVIDGKMLATKKYRGSFARCVEEYASQRLGSREDIDCKRVFITSSEVPDEAMEAVKGALAEYGCFRQIHETKVGCTVACHCGPGTLGIVFLRK